MNALAASVALAVLTAVLAAVGTYLTTRRNLQATFDTSLRDLRIDAYKLLWLDLEGLAKYARPKPLTEDEAGKLAVTLRKWYFETGGLFLSVRTRQDYFALLDGLETVTAAAEKRLRPEDDEFLRVLGSRLRTGMTADVGTRRTFPFPEESTYAGPPVRTFAGADGRPLVVSRSRRRFLLFGRRTATLAVGGASLVRWHPARDAFTATVAESGAVDERLFLLEDTHVVEGPKGWQRGATTPRRGAAIWKKNPD
jgi:hypothetical protein